MWVTTNELPAAGTKAQVSITVYGHKGNSGPIPLGNADGETFEAGNIDEFEVSIVRSLKELTLKVLVATIDAQWEGMGNVGLVRYEPALLPPCPTIRVLTYSN